MHQRYSGLTDGTYRKFVIESGEVRLGYVDASSQGTLLGATRGGSTFTIETTYREMAVDGAKGPVKGSRRIEKVIAKMEVTFIEFSPELIALALPGSTTEETPAVTPTHKEIRRALQLGLANYSSSVALIGEVSGSDHPIVCILENVLADGGFSIGTKDANESDLKVQFTAHFDPSTLAKEPWAVRFPLDCLTTEGA
jgi:hypothetical protein